MNGTKIIRRVDDLGRVVIPKEIRCALEIHEGDNLEICVDKDSVTFRKEGLSMTTERAIELLSSGITMPAIPHSAEELNEACRMACESLRAYTPRIMELAQADRVERAVILPDTAYTDADGEEALRRAMWDCNHNNNGVTRFAADAIAEKLVRDESKGV